MTKLIYTYIQFQTDHCEKEAIFKNIQLSCEVCVCVCEKDKRRKKLFCYLILYGDMKERNDNEIETN